MFLEVGSMFLELLKLKTFFTVHTQESEVHLWLSQSGKKHL